MMSISINRQLKLIQVVCLLLMVRSTAAKRVGDRFGVNFHLPDNGKFKGFEEGELELMARAYKVVRFDMLWENVEKTCGTYDFSEFDPVVAALIGSGLRPYVILDYDNSCYAESRSGNYSSSKSHPCTSDECIKGYGNWAKAVAKHYSDFAGSMSFTSTNEPNAAGHGDDPADADYQMTKRAGKAFIAEGFDFVGGVTGGVDVDYHKKLIKLGVLKYVTAMSTHPYSHDEPESRINELRELRSAMDKNGGEDIKLLLDEWGYPFGGYPDSADEAAQYVPRMWLVCLAFSLKCDLGVFFSWPVAVSSHGQPLFLS